MHGSEFVLTLVALALYMAASVLAIMGLLRPSPGADRRVLVLAACAALPLVIVLLQHGLAAGHVRAISRFEAFSIYGIVLTGAYLLICVKRPRMRGMAALVIPYVTVMLILGMPAIQAEAVLAPSVQSIWLKLHIVSAFLGYASFSLAGVMAVAYLVQDRNLKGRNTGVLATRLPALETLDRMMSAPVAIAFLMLTISIVLGVLLVRVSGGGDEWVTDPKVVSTVLTWCIFAVLVHMRAWANQHGRRVALVIIMGVLCLLFGFVGVHVVATSVHDYLHVGGAVNPP
ncbi:MAG: cytochrome c biogenesis protein CcsA [Verrucomicrobia bacterium]|nr:cytochrome c biogenesis protein CcsA [Verrucomicrobiota bacterium]